MMSWPWPDGEPFPGDRKQAAAPPVTLDARLADLADRRLRADPTTRDEHITVDVQNGVALLSGQVTAAETRWAAAQVVRDVPGIREICDTLTTTTERDGKRPVPGAVTALAAAVWLALLLVVVLGWAGVAIGALIAVIALKLFWGRRLRVVQRRPAPRDDQSG